MDVTDDERLATQKAHQGIYADPGSWRLLNLALRLCDESSVTAATLRRALCEIHDCASPIA